MSPKMTSLPAKVIAIEKRGDQYQVIVQIGTKYRGSFNTLAFGEIKPYIGSLKDGRLDLVYYRDPGLVSFALKSRSSSEAFSSGSGIKCKNILQLNRGICI